MKGSELKKLENELWRAADQLRANSKLTATEYSMPVLGLIFLRHAFNRFDRVREEVEQHLPVHPQRGKRPVRKEDFLQRNALYLPEAARFDHLVNLPESEDIGEAIDRAMRAIEDDHEGLRGVLPKNYGIFSADLLRELLRIFNKEVLQKAEGDLFGKIYEYFLNKFAMTGAQEGGEFFTPMSLVQTIVNVIEPDHGTVFDPACGSAGMFVQTGYFIESEGLRPAEKVTFFGQEKAEVNTRLAKMNLAVHGLEGDIREGNTFYEDKHALCGQADFVMANPPFNVDGVDKGKDSVKKDPRLKLDGKVLLPKNDNANYLWITYFYNYLNPTGRAGFVMASSASDAGHSERTIREKLVQTGAVDVMIAIGNNFFYTRSLPCTLWFFDRSKEQDPERSDRTLMLDARKIFRKVTSKINDFSPEQLRNLTAIVDLYRGHSGKFEAAVQDYLDTAAQQAAAAGEACQTFREQVQHMHDRVAGFARAYEAEDKEAEPFSQHFPIQAVEEAQQPQDDFVALATQKTHKTPAAQTPVQRLAALAPVAEACPAVRKAQEKAVKALLDTVSDMIKAWGLNKNKAWKQLDFRAMVEELRLLQNELMGQPEEEEPGLLHGTAYFHQQARWLLDRFPEGTYADVEGLCKVVSREAIEAKDWSLSPGRYVGVAPSEDEHIDYEARLHELHRELSELNEEAAALAQTIQENFKALGV